MRDLKLTEDAIEFVRTLLIAHIPKIAVENPVGVISTRVCPPCQIIQPYQFGHDASKKTCLWLVGLPFLKRDVTKYVPGRCVGVDKLGRTVLRWSNQTDSGQNRLGPSEDRWAKRSVTYQGIADAMADQWGCL